ncbi:MAG: double zinc ribbon domain-containing protein [Roseinatronobacter sp.]|nr:double zinc ribbon domain-containing protein [Roseinatronobacter sp.]
MQNQRQSASHLGHRLARSLIRALYPPQCMTCDAQVEDEGMLCPQCWPQTPFIFGACCDSCGLPLPGDGGDAPLHCDDCLILARPWEQGRAALLYEGRGRQIVLGLKHHDRHDLARPAARWMARAARPMLQPDMLRDILLAPVPLHWLRLAARRYNQAALLAGMLAQELAGDITLDYCPDLLVRNRHTGNQDGRGRMGRFANVAEAFAPHPRQRHRIAGRHILLVDDVMTAGATFTAAADTCLAHGAASVRVIALARVARAQ